ncbi:MAG TPA: response regulator transcription factor, partial [Candidatus Acidoferrales bacterium]|nr:response regulator transcription factor [Candidatus Acidoferrales bacterium]
MSVDGRVARVVIADDQTLFRVGLARLLNEDPRVDIVGDAADGLQALELVASTHPDVVLMDLKMPNLDGVEATKRIVAEHPSVKVLVLTTFDADSYVIQALKAGASGYVLKDSLPDAIVSSIRSVLSGERVMASA